MQVKATLSFSKWLELIVLLCGGDKSRQSRDIAQAYKLVRNLEN